MLPTAAQFREQFPFLKDTGEDTEIDAWISRADAVCAVWCGMPRNAAGKHTLQQSDHVLYPEIHPRESRALWLQLALCGTPTAVYVAETREWDAAHLLDASEYELFAEQRMLMRAGSGSGTAWSLTRFSNRVELPVGDPAVSTDENLLVAIMHAARHLWDNRKTQGRSQIDRTGVSVSLSEAAATLPARVTEQLAPYVNWTGVLG